MALAGGGRPFFLRLDDIKAMPDVWSPAISGKIS